MANDVPIKTQIIIQYPCLHNFYSENVSRVLNAARSSDVECQSSDVWFQNGHTVWIFLLAVRDVFAYIFRPLRFLTLRGRCQFERHNSPHR